MKKVLFLTYFWPPSGKATLHWPLKVIKYLPEFGWEVTVLTAKEDSFTVKDESLLSEVSPNLEVVKVKTLEPFGIYKKFTGKEKDAALVASETISATDKSLTHKISIWIRMNLFVPDARIGWYLPAVSEGKKILKGKNFDVIISIGPPHSTHVVAMKLAKKSGIPHFPVLIDPWVDIIYYKNFKRSTPTLAFDNFLEKSVMKNAKVVIFVTETTRNDYISKYNFLGNKSHVLYWGYNEDDFKNLTPVLLPLEGGKGEGSFPKEGGSSGEEVLVHAGNIFDYQNPKVFWAMLKNEIKRGRKLKIKFIGTVGPLIKKEIEDAGLNSITEYLGFLPYKKMLEELNKASYLLVCATEKRHVPGKLFEYLRSGKPIIAFGDDNQEVKKILEEANAGMIFHYDEDGKEFFDKVKTFNTDIAKVKTFDRKNITAGFAEILRGNLQN
jgi:glycosyltransferase involved in cell wall biosynthesis